MRVDWSEIVRLMEVLMEVSAMFYKYTYCVLLCLFMQISDDDSWLPAMLCLLLYHSYNWHLYA